MSALHRRTSFCAVFAGMEPFGQGLDWSVPWCGPGAIIGWVLIGREVQVGLPMGLLLGSLA